MRAVGGLSDHAQERLFLEDLLKPNHIGVHRQQLIGQPILFPGVFLGGVALETVIFAVRPDQVLDVEAGDGGVGHGRVSDRILAKATASTLPPETVTMTVSASRDAP